MLGLAGAILVGGALFFSTFYLMRAAEQSEAEKRFMDDYGDESENFKLPFYIFLTQPFLKGAYADLARGFWKEGTLEKHKKQLVSAGLYRFFDEVAFVAAKFWMTLAWVVFLIIYLLFSEGQKSPVFPVISTLAVFFLPNLDVRSKKKNRQFEIKISMPYVTDLLTLSMEAGLDFLGAVSKVIEQAPPGPLVYELSIVLKDIQLGNSRAVALRAMADRVDMTEMSSFVAVIISSEQMGASIGTALRGQSDSMRNERLTRAEKLAAQASQKILIPLVFFILPAVMIMIFGPLILQMLGVK